jgi:hypothetical protein
VNQRHRHPVAGGEVVQGALRLCAPQRYGRDLDRTKAVVLSAGWRCIGHGWLAEAVDPGTLADRTAVGYALRDNERSQLRLGIPP